VAWSCYSYRLIIGDHEVFYFDSEGQINKVNSGEYFKERIENYSNHETFYRFYIGLGKIGEGKYSRNIVSRDEIYFQVSNYVKVYMRKHKIRQF
jgi:hypothetical protein